jgi:hypothetical protein
VDVKVCIYLLSIDPRIPPNSRLALNPTAFSKIRTHNPTPGDRDVTYDANLICPIVLASKAVLFNWKDSLQKDKLLNMLGIVARAAASVAPEEEDGGEGGVDGACVWGVSVLVVGWIGGSSPYVRCTHLTDPSNIASYMPSLNTQHGKQNRSSATFTSSFATGRTRATTPPCTARSSNPRTVRGAGVPLQCFFFK